MQPTLFSFSESIPTPTNQHELVLYTLIFPPKELSMGYWMNHYKSHKFSTRLGEVEKELGISLVERKQTQFTNRFGHNSHYVVYVPVLKQSEYVELYKKIIAKS